MPAPFARATASFASSRGGSIMPIRPRKTRSCSTRSSNAVALERVLRQRAEGDARACAAPRRPAPRWSPGSPRGAPRVRGRRLLAHQLVRAAREQDVRRALGEDEQTLLPLGVACGPCSSACARRRTAPPPTRAKRASSASASSPALRAATISAPSVGSPCTVQRPSRSCSTALLARSAAASARTSFEPERAVDRPAPVPPHLAFGRVAGAAEASRARSP